MRASATSRIATAHAAHTAQGAAANANKADDTSPFALLLASTAPKTAAKDTAKDKTQDDQDQDAAALQDGKDKAAQTDTATKTDTSAKADAGVAPDAGSDKTSDRAEDDTKTADAVPPPADTSGQAQANLAALQALQMAQPQQQAKAQPTNQDKDGDDTVGATNGAPSGTAGSNAPAQPQAAPSAATKDATPAPQDAAGDDDTTDAVTGVPGTKTASKAGAAKTADAKPGDAKAQTDKAQADKADAKADIKPDAQPAPPPVQSADAKAAAPQAHATGPAVPQTAAATSAANTSITQHVQVAAEVRPNIPALAVEVAAKSQAGAKQFDIRLDPPELGRVEVRLSIDATGKASAHLTADQPQTLDLLQKDSSSLTRALRDAGLDVSQNGLNFSLRQQSQDGGNANSGSGGGRGGARAFSVTQSLDATPSSAAYRGPADGRLDIKV